MQEESKELKPNVIRHAPSPAKEAHEEEMTIRHAAALALVGWYLLIPPVFSPMGDHPRAFNDLNASLKKWDIWAPFESETSCKREKERIQSEAPLRLKFAREYPDQDRNGNIVAVAEAWQRAECIATDDPRLKPN
jgi:hypothetical protein